MLCRRRRRTAEAPDQRLDGEITPEEQLSDDESESFASEAADEPEPESELEESAAVAAVELSASDEAEEPPDEEDITAVRSKDFVDPVTPPYGPRKRIPPGDEDEITIPGGEEPPPFADRPAFSEDALRALRDEEEEVAAADEPTIERPGMVARGFALRDLAPLEINLNQDDRVLPEDEEPRVDFRGGAVSGELQGSDRVEDEAEFDDDGDDEEQTAERSMMGSLDDEPTRERRADDGSWVGVVEDAPAATLDLDDPLGELDLVVGSVEAPLDDTVDRAVPSEDGDGPSAAVIVDESLLISEQSADEEADKPALRPLPREYARPDTGEFGEGRDRGAYPGTDHGCRPGSGTG